LRDALAGFELAAMNIPQALGYTKIAGMPLVTGLYTLLLPLLAFAVFGSSRFLVVAADSATAAILASGISPMAPVGSSRYVALAGMVALLTAGFLLLARLLKLGFLADFLSRTVLVGFLTGIGFQVGIAVLGEMLGIEVQSRRTSVQLIQVLRGLSHATRPTVALSAIVVGGIYVLQRFAPKVPGALIAVAGTVTASATWNFAGHGIAIIGPIVGGLPHLGLPNVNWKDVEALISVAASCVVVIVAQSAATSRVYAMRHEQLVDDNADLVGLSAANAAAALSGTFVVNGSPTQTAMVESSGGRSQLAQVVTAVVVALVLLFLTRPLQYLPRCVLSAIVFTIGIKLIDVRGLWSICSESPGEFRLAVTTAAVVVLLGVEEGIVLAMVLSLLRVVRHSYHPHTAVLVETESGIWRLTPAIPGAITQPGLVIYRFGASLFYANANLFSEEILSLVKDAPSAVRWMVVDAGAIASVDYTAAWIVRKLQQELSSRGTELAFAHVQSDLTPDLERHHLAGAPGQIRIFTTLREMLVAFAKHEKTL
jgi:MFS superfamily sulfate permease-like transporter